MPIIINEFEIIPEAAPPQRSQAQPPQQAGANQPIRPEDIIRVQRLHNERKKRIRAT